MSQKSSVPQDVSFVSQVMKRDSINIPPLPKAGRWVRYEAGRIELFFLLCHTCSLVIQCSKPWKIPISTLHIVANVDW